MERAEFDRFADEYEHQHARNVRLSGEGPAFFARYKVQDVARLCAGQSVARILDFGAGVGNSIPHWREFFHEAALTCLDVSARSLAIASRRYPNAADYQLFDGREIPFPDGQFDVVFAACVFHHIDESHQVPMLRELRRVLAPGGRLIVFEHNPLNPLTVRAVNTCEFDANAVLLRAGVLSARVRAAGFDHLSLAYRLFFPRALCAMRPLEPWLTRLPLGAQYRLCAQ